MKPTSELLISADSHVIEPPELWAERLPAAFRDRAPRYPKQSHFQDREGGTNPVARVKEMAMDGVSGEILYPSLAMNQFGIEDAALQEACFRVYNDWLIEYCAHSPQRLFGVGLASLYQIDNAIREAQRCKQAGMCGLMIWQVPPEGFEFSAAHYERFWAAAQELEMPISLHILTGTNNRPGAGSYNGTNALRHLTSAVNMKMLYAANALTQFIISGVLERYPKLKMVIVENEVSWLPFVISQLDKYCARGRYDTKLGMLPGEFFRRQLFATFFDDPPSRWLFSEWGTDNCMWSNDFPHPNSTWPKSRDVIARDLGHLPEARRAKLLRDNVVNLYGLPEIVPVAAAA